jgi:hypothetical protein
LLYENNTPKKVKNINAYLLDAENIFVESHSKPICNVPTIGIGNQPIDGGYYLLNEDEKDEFIKKEPKSSLYFKRWIGADEFIKYESFETSLFFDFSDCCSLKALARILVTLGQIP